MYGRSCESQRGFIEMLETIQVVFLVKKKRISLKHEGELLEFEKSMQTLDVFIKYFSGQWERV